MHLRWRSNGAIGITVLTYLPVIWRLLGALVLGVLVAKWCWLLFAPRASAVDVVPEHEITAETGRLFGIVVANVVPTVVTALPNVQLVGVFAGRVGQPGFAVLKLDEKKQLGVVVGDNVVPGTKLLEAHPDYVLLEHAGSQQRVNLKLKTVAAVGVKGSASGETDDKAN
jgi:hypothetical protein